MKKSDYFRDFGDGSFRAVRFWVEEDENTKQQTLYTCVCFLQWQDVEMVEGWPTPNPYAEQATPRGPKTVLMYGGSEVKLLAPLADVAKAWAAHRRRVHLPTICAN